MNERTALSVLSMLKENGMVPDPYAAKKPDNVYTVTSLYLDSPILADYNDKAGGFLNRKKIRVRIYTPILAEATPEIWLEKKEKYDMLVAKKRILLTHEGYKALMDESYADLLTRFRSSAEGTRILHTIIRARMRPKAIVRYSRLPLVSLSYSDIRITLDSRIETCLAENLWYNPPMIPVAPHTTILEMKFSRVVPHWFRFIRDHHHLERAPFSKYANSLETIYRYHPIPR